MTQLDLDQAVAVATGESLAFIQDRGFGIADPLDPRFEPEPRRPMVFDWDEMAPVEWPA